MNIPKNSLEYILGEEPYVYYKIPSYIFYNIDPATLLIVFVIGDFTLNPCSRYRILVCGVFYAS